MEVVVRDNNVDQGLRVIKKRMQKEGVFRVLKNKRFYEKPSERRARRKDESKRRIRKLQRKSMDRDMAPNMPRVRRIKVLVTS